MTTILILKVITTFFGLLIGFHAIACLVVAIKLNVGYTPFYVFSIISSFLLTIVFLAEPLTKLLISF